MIKEERMKVLRFQAENYGLTPPVAARLTKEGHKLKDQDGMMVMITVGELQEFLFNYPEEKQDGHDGQV